MIGRVGKPFARAARRAGAWLRRHPRFALTTGGFAALLLVTGALFPHFQGADPLSVRVERGTLVVRLTEAGVVKPAEALSYRSPLAGRETEIIFLAPEGLRVNEGDLVVRLETTELERELERAVQDLRQARADLQVAESEREEAKAAVESLTAGQGALALDESRQSLQLTEKKVARLRTEYESLKPLLDKGYITQEELDRTLVELEQAQAELDLAQRKTEVYAERTYPQELRKARFHLVNREAAVENARAKAAESESQLRWLQASIAGCNIYARMPGLVVYEEYLGGNPRRKIRVGDRVTRSQVILTIPEVSRMLVETSVREADVHRVAPGQPAVIALDAFPGLTLRGKVTQVGALARSEPDRDRSEKRFNLTVEITDAAGADLKPDMTARVDVVVGERPDVLLLPVNAVFDQDGLWVAHLVRAWGVETRSIEVGDTNGTHVEIRAGLQEGDRVALVDLGGGGGAQTGSTPSGGSSLRSLLPQGGKQSEPLAPR